MVFLFYKKDTYILLYLFFKNKQVELRVKRPVTAQIIVTVCPNIPFILKVQYYCVCSVPTNSNPIATLAHISVLIFE